MCGPGSSVGIATGYGFEGPGTEPRWGARFSAPVQTGSGTHPASHTRGTGSFPGIKSGRGMTLTHHPFLVPWSRKGRAIPLLPLWAVRPVQSLSACTKVHFRFFTFDIILTACSHILLSCCHKLSLYCHKCKFHSTKYMYIHTKWVTVIQKESNFKQYNFVFVIRLLGDHYALTWIKVSFCKQLITGATLSLNVRTLTKSLLPSVSNMLLTTCRAFSWLAPVIEPELSTRMMTSFGLNEASMYHSLTRQSNMSTCDSFLNTFLTTPENTQQSSKL